MTSYTPQFLTPSRLTDARDLFPFLTTGRIYLNHAATSPLSTRVVDAMTDHLRTRSVSHIDSFRIDLAMIEELRTNVATLIHAENGSRIAFNTNTSDALNIIATGIDWKQGDRIILNRAEFPANVYPYLSAQNQGAHIDQIEAINGVVTPNDIERLISPHTRLVALSAVQFLSGYKADMKAIGDLCRSRGILFIVDGIQCVGASPIDVQEMKIDGMSAGAQKWQMSPHGTGFLYVSESLQERLSQKHVGWLGVKEPWDFFNYDQPMHPTAKRYEGGTLNFPGLWGMSAAIKTILEFGIETISNHLHGLTDLLIGEMDAMDEFVLMTPRDYDHRAGIATVTTRSIDAKDVFSFLESQRIDISLRQGALRFSPHFYNTPAEILRVTSALKDFLSKH